MAIIAAGLLLMDTEALMGFGAVFSGLFGGGETEIGVTTRITTLGDAVDFTDQLVSNEATLMPLLGDLALISTGATTQSITRAATSTAINQFAANFENVFKPEVKVMVGTTELDARIDNRIATTAMGTQ